MDEFNTNFDPTDEYESIESQDKPLDNTQKDTINQEALAQNAQENTAQLRTAHTQSEKPQIPVTQPVYQQPFAPQPFVPQQPCAPKQAQQPYAPVPQPFVPQPQYPAYYNQYQQNMPNHVAPKAGYNASVAPPVYGDQYYHATQKAPAYMPPQQTYAPNMQRPQPNLAYSNMPPQAVQNPYTQNNFPMYNTNQEKKKTSAKAKVFIASMVVLLVLFAVAIVLLVAQASNKDNKNTGNDHPLSGFATEPESLPDSYYDFSPNYSPYKESDFDIEITLEPDEGQTQNSLSSDKANIYPANKDAKKLKTESLPKDKDSSKYTAQSSYNAVTDSVVTIECYKKEITDKEEDIIGAGTGTIVTSDGYIITNSHVILNSNSYKVKVTLNNSKEYTAKVAGFDTRTDIAVLKIDCKDLSAVKFADSSKVAVGQDIIAIGTPANSSFQNSLTKGIVSAVEREIELSKTVKYLQTDAAINPGNSGGPLCNLYGQVIGMNTAKISSVDYEGIGFAIPSNTVVKIANDLIHYGYVKDRVRLGITGIALTEYDAYDYGVPQGVLIKDIDKDGPFADTDAQSYDIITAINGVTVASFEDIYGELEKYKAGDKITVTLHRVENKK